MAPTVHFCPAYYFVFVCYANAISALSEWKLLLPAISSFKTVLDHVSLPSYSHSRCCCAHPNSCDIFTLKVLLCSHYRSCYVHTQGPALPKRIIFRFPISFTLALKTRQYECQHVLISLVILLIISIIATLCVLSMLPSAPCDTFLFMCTGVQALLEWELQSCAPWVCCLHPH